MRSSGSRSNVNVRENVSGRFITSLNRTGRPIAQYDFQGNSKEGWVQNAGTVSVDGNGKIFGLYSLKLVTGTSDADVAQSSVFIGRLAEDRIGFEFWFRVADSAANVEEIVFNLNYRDGTYNFNAQVKWLGEANKKWQYMASGGSFTDITDGAHDLLVTDLGIHYLKLVIDFNTDKYVKFIIDDKEFDLSDLALKESSDTGKMKSIEGLATIKNATATAARTMYMDNVVFTKDEP